MTQEDKELLFQYLSMALPHGLIIDPIDCGPAKLVGVEGCDALLYDLIHEKKYDKPWDIEYIKPYLYSMDDMTEEEWEDYQKIKMQDWVSGNINGVFINAGLIVVWLLKKHFDFMGLIERGLAIKVTNENNLYKN